MAQTTLPFKTDYNDHFQTPLNAYEDISSLLLSSLTSSNPSPTSPFTVYDPYYCTGSVPDLIHQSLSESTLTTTPQSQVKVINLPRDFYADIANNATPPHDLLITNPPYSGDHKIKCFEYCAKNLTFPSSRMKGYAVLLPSYIAGKSYYSDIVSKYKIRNNDTNEYKELFIIPPSSSKYSYAHPDGTGYDSSPFFSIWFVGVHGSLFESFKSYVAQYNADTKSGVRLIEDYNELALMDSKSGKSTNTTSAGGSAAVAFGFGKRKSPKARKKEKKRLAESSGITVPDGVVTLSKTGINLTMPPKNFTSKSEKGGKRQKVNAVKAAKKSQPNAKRSDGDSNATNGDRKKKRF